RIDGLGGMLAAIASGWVAQQIHDAAYQWHREVESGERVVVGVNMFATDEATPPPPFAPDPATERERAGFLAAWRAERNAKEASTALARLARGARGDDNLMPLILDALVKRATLGEVCDTLRGVFGVHRPGQAG